VTGRRRLVILTEGDAVRGLGHVVRCSAYAEGWQERGGEVQWVVDGDDRAAALAAVTGAVHRQAWQEGASLRLTVQDVVLVDSYALTQAAADRIGASAGPVVVIDDLGTIAWPGALVVRPAGVGDEVEMAGPRWQPLRAAFREAPARETVSEAVDQVLVILGGTDVRGLSDRMVGVVRRVWPQARIDVLGSALPGPRLTAHRDCDAGAVARLMARADVAVSAAGQAVFELARCGTPSVIVQVAANQAPSMTLWPVLAGFEAAGGWDDPDLDDRVEVALRRLAPADRRLSMARRAQAAVDGRGVDRVLDRLDQTDPTLR